MLFWLSLEFTVRFADSACNSLLASVLSQVSIALTAMTV